jgi:spermidine synthase
VRPSPEDAPVVVDRRETDRGELVLRRAGGHFEVIADGMFLMDTRDGRSERALVTAAAAGRTGLRLLLGGLGVGFSLDEALRGDGAREVVVAEVEPVVAEWARTHLRGVTANGLDDPRVRLELRDVRAVLDTAGDPFDAICLDVDNGPGWLVHPANAALYTDAGLGLMRRRLAADGRLAVWAAAPEAEFEAGLRRTFAAVDVLRFPVVRGPDDVVYVARREN